MQGLFMFLHKFPYNVGQISPSGPQFPLKNSNYLPHDWGLRRSNSFMLRTFTGCRGERQGKYRKKKSPVKYSSTFNRLYFSHSQLILTHQMQWELCLNQDFRPNIWNFVKKPYALKIQLILDSSGIWVPNSFVPL